METVGPSFVSQTAYDINKTTGGIKADSENTASKLLYRLTGTIREENEESDKASQEGVRDVTASNSFLMRIVHGRVPNQLL